MWMGVWCLIQDGYTMGGVKNMRGEEKRGDERRGAERRGEERRGERRGDERGGEERRGEGRRGEERREEGRRGEERRGGRGAEEDTCDIQRIQQRKAVTMARGGLGARLTSFNRFPRTQLL